MKIVLTPDWFLGKDVLIEIFSFIVLFAFFLLCLRYYKLNKKKNILYLGLGFLLISAAQIAIILTKLVLYYDTTLTQQIGQMVITYSIVRSVDLFYYLGFFFQRILTLLGFYIIYRLPVKRKARGDFFLVLYFIFLSTVLNLVIYYSPNDLGLISESFFHITALIILALIIRNYLIVYSKNKLLNTKILIIAFSILALGHAISLFSKSSTMFVIANLIELLSYMILLLLIIRILRGEYRNTSQRQGFLKHGKKKE